MIEGIIEWSIRNRTLVILAWLAVGVAGLRAMLTTPVDAIPDLSENQVIVFADWMGRSPQEVEDQITYPLSVNLQGLAGVKVVRSSSEFNFSMITIIFDDATDYYFARQRVLERLSDRRHVPARRRHPVPRPRRHGGRPDLLVHRRRGRQGPGRAPVAPGLVRPLPAQQRPGRGRGGQRRRGPEASTRSTSTPTKLRAYGITLGEVDSAVGRSNSAVGGRVIHQGAAEYLIRSVGWIESLDDIRATVVARRGAGTPIRIADLGTVQMGPEFRRSVLEKDGREAVGGVVLMRTGENPLAVTDRIKAKIAALEVGLKPQGVRIVPFYDRTPLIRGAIATVGGTVREELIVCTLAILLVMGHLGSAFVVALTLPLAILVSFLLIRLFGMSANIMSLAGISISVGILIDQAVVMGENAAHHLSRHFGRNRVTGDTTEIVIRACRTVGRPIFFSVLITILSFLPVFALSGREGKLFHPLAYTKTFALVGVALLSITLVPALIPIFLRGRIRSEDENWLVRTMIAIFRPMLAWLMDRTTLVCWLFAIILGLGYLASTRLGREFMPDLDEGSIMDMPTTVPRASVAQVAADLRVRDAILRDFPEVALVVGKAGRAETPTDPSPLDMIETIVTLRDRDLWPKRQLRFADARAQADEALAALERRGLIRAAAPDDRAGLLDEAAMAVADGVDRALRDLATRRLRDFRPELGRALVGDLIDDLLAHVAPASVVRSPTPDERTGLVAALTAVHGDRLAADAAPGDAPDAINDAARRLVALGVLRASPNLLAPPPTALERVAAAAGDLVGLDRATLTTRIADRLAEARVRRAEARIKTLNYELFDRAAAVGPRAALDSLAKLARDRQLAARPPSPDDLQTILPTLERVTADRLLLWRKTKADLVAEMDTALQMPGWGNSFTQPIANRIEMLSTGVRLPVAAKVFGPSLAEVQRIGGEVAAVLRAVPGAANVFADQVTGKPYVEIHIDRAKASRYGINVGDVQDVVEVAMGGKPLTQTVEGRERYPVRVRYARDFRDDVAALRTILVGGAGMAPAAASMAGGADGDPMTAPAPVPQPGAGGPIPLGAVADVRVVEGPAMIKSENGLLRAYVQCRVQGRDEVGFVEEARRAVAERVVLPAGMYVEWSGTFEHQARAQRTLRVVFPAVIAVIALILYLTHKSWVDAALMMTSVLGALAGGAIFQWLFGFHFSVAVQVGYIACFGMAVETGVVMLVYLREAIADRGGLEAIGSVDELRTAILDGAIHRLRPKLLTEGAAIVSIAPMLWATGVGAEVIRPMAAPVLGGLLIADEVIDVFLPVLYFATQKRRWAKIHRVDLWAALVPARHRRSVAPPPPTSTTIP